MVQQPQRITILLAPVFLGLLGAMTAHSQTASDGPTARTASLPTKEIRSGDCVLLNNDHVLYGTARQLGEWVIVTSGNGGEVKLKRQQVACWAPSVRDLYRYRVDHRQSGDIKALLRDAEWCLRYELLDLAAKDLRAVYAIDANNPTARRIEKRLRGQVARQPDAGSHENQHTSVLDAATTGTPTTEASATEAPLTGTPMTGTTATQPTGIHGQQSEDQPDAEDQILGQIEDAAIAGFAGQIQPLLVNRCGNCHAQRVADVTKVQWRIFAPPSGTRASAEFTRTNLKATLPYIDRYRPAASPLLKFAMSPHGNGVAPLGKRNAKAIQALERWVGIVGNAINSIKESELTVMPNEQKTVAMTTDEDETLPPTTSTTNPPNASGPARLPPVENPFDPDLFNRRFRMQTQGTKVPSSSDS